MKTVTFVPQRVGIVVLPTPKLNEPALRCLILAMNKEQRAFQFEFYDASGFNHSLKDKMSSADKPVSHCELRTGLPEFVNDLRSHLASEAEGLLEEGLPVRMVVVAPRSTIDSNFYTIRRDPGSVLALGNWERHLAPPSLFEFIQVLLVREAVAITCPSLSGNGHLGNKGCLMDFTRSLSEARQKVLDGNVCHFCRSRMEADHSPELVGSVTHLLDRGWLGTPNEPHSPASLAANLGYNLFITKGLKATAREGYMNAFRQEIVKQILTVVGTLILAFVLLHFLGIKVSP